MIIIGVDPGSRNTGYGVIEYQPHVSHVIDYGVIKLAATQEMGERLSIIHEKLKAVISAHKPDYLCLETAFYSKNILSTMKLGYARGIVLFTASQAGVPVLELSPREVKKTITGNGSSSKPQVYFWIQKILNIGELPNYDISDAFALAISAGIEIGPGSSPIKKVSQSSKRRRRQSWGEFVDQQKHRVIS